MNNVHTCHSKTRYKDFKSNFIIERHSFCISRNYLLQEFGIHSQSFSNISFFFLFLNYLNSKSFMNQCVWMKVNHFFDHLCIITLWLRSCTSSKLTSLYMSSVVSQFELRPDELKLDDLYNWLKIWINWDIN